MDSRFCTRFFDGSPRQFFFVEEIQIDTQSVDTDVEPSHHIIVVDASGSMYSDMSNMRSVIEKVLTLEEFADVTQLVSFLSYSSQGDVITHFSRVYVSDVMAPNSVYLNQIRNLNVRGYTCISGALEVARTLCQPGELTCISLHSDGYANDSSPTAERRAVDRIIGDFATMSDVYVNTIAYRQGSDYTFLNSISNALSGKCIQANRINDVYNALHDTSALLAGKRTPAIVNQIGNAQYQIFVSKADRKLNGTSGELRVNGLSDTGDKTIYRYREVDEQTYYGSSLPECSSTNDLTPVYAFARAMISEGRLNVAKYATLSTQAVAYTKHYNAITSTQIKEFANSLENSVFDNGATQYSTSYGVDTSVHSVLDILNVLDKWSSSISINVASLAKSYKRIGLKKVVGVRNSDGNLELPWVDTIDSHNDYSRLSAVEINRTTANINLRTTKSISLVDRNTRTPITNVAGIDLDLKDFRNWTVVANGELRLPQLHIKISDKRAFNELKSYLNDSSFNADSEYVIDLSNRPVISYTQTFKSIDLKKTFMDLMHVKVLKSILTTLTETSSVKYTAEQIAELKRHYLSPALNLSLPTTNEYTDLKTAISEGRVDSRSVFNIDLGTTEILNASKFKSANDYLQRRFVFTIGKDEYKGSDLKWNLWWNPECKVSVKKLTAATKLDSVDDFMMPIFEDFLKVSQNGSLNNILDILDIKDTTLKSELSNILTNRDASLNDKAVEVFKEILDYIKNFERVTYSENVSPLAFYIGSTGLVPDDLNAEMFDYDKLSKEYPSLKFSKDEKEATFFKVGESLISVYVTSEYYTC